MRLKIILRYRYCQDQKAKGTGKELEQHLPQRSKGPRRRALITNEMRAVKNATAPSVPARSIGIAAPTAAPPTNGDGLRSADRQTCPSRSR